MLLSICAQNYYQFVRKNFSFYAQSNNTILGKFEREKYIKEIEVSGRKRTYRLTERGLAAYREEVERLAACVADAESELDFGGEFHV